MMWRHLCLARAIAASGFLSCSLLGSSHASEPGEPIPAADSEIVTIPVLDAEAAGKLAVDVRGSGAESVQLKLKNQTANKLRIVLPPGLVASTATSQGGAGGGPGGGAGGGGFQNMGLGAVGNQGGGFGQFAASKPEVGFRSIPVEAVEPNSGVVTVPVGQTVEVSVPAVCLNFGAPTPTSKNRFRLVDVDQYSTDARIRKSLRTLATLGTSHGMAQATMWHVCNGLSFEEMLARGEKTMNLSEVSLAARFVRALDSGANLGDTATGRIFVSVTGTSDDSKDVARLARELDGLRILGLPVQVLARGEVPSAPAPVLHLGVTLGSTDAHEAKGKVVVQAGEGIERLDWTTIGTARLDDLTMADLDGLGLARAIDHAVGSTFVTTRVAKRSANGTTLEIRNRLPFTVANVVVKAGSSPTAPLVDVAGVGVGPGRSGKTTVAAANGTVDRVELNGL